ncbi:hypothetical protein Vretimale_17288 [Volvox reticuliferus]|uniref:Uncharacterized protein n=1 Tax=Volvox reticuliferus TaxID=1737510 RepID=A0A8J4CRX8_9CHLO|nr:hypothetical protein Vretifemale_16621 [Volvox reticuliferus]GIM14271.1 hypothetical protein Vretimale_17288 [Volvox reticuliferus]
MDAGPFFVLGAWAPLPSHIVAKDRPEHYQPTPTAKKAVTTLPQQIPTKVFVAGHKSAPCMRGPGREFLPTDLTKGNIECTRPEAKADSITDETPLGLWSRSGFASRNSAGRRGSGSTPSSPPPSAVLELPTVAAVLRTAKLLLQPTHAIERQFYEDCYRACRVMPATTTAVPSSNVNNAAGRCAGGRTDGGPYLSSIPEVALRLSCLGHRMVVRRVTDSRHYWSRSMTNMFCYCVLPDTGIGYVLDPSFKDHFRAAMMSDRYRDIWECLPPLFVGPPAKLVQLVQVLCTELQVSFKNSDCLLPPWRAFTCNIYRWMSPVFRDLPVPLRRPMPAGKKSGTMDMIPAADAQAFLRACAELMVNTPSALPRSSTAVATVAPSSSVSSVALATAGGAPGAAARSLVTGSSTAVAVQRQGTCTTNASGLSGSAVEGKGRGMGSRSLAASRGCGAARCPLAASSGDGTSQPMPHGSDGGGAVERMEVADGAVNAPTATKAAASSAARAPLHTVVGFELRQHVTVQPHVQEYAGGEEAMDAALTRNSMANVSATTTAS